MNKRFQLTAVVTIGALALTGCSTLTAGTGNDVVTSDVDPDTTAVTNVAHSAAQRRSIVSVAGE